jgi:hypothetical protein
MKNGNELLQNNRNHGIIRGTWLARVFALLLGLAAMPATAQACEPESFTLLNQWILTTPLPILLLKVFGVVLVLGVVAISAYLFLVPEQEHDPQERG